VLPVLLLFIWSVRSNGGQKDESRSSTSQVLRSKKNGSDMICLNQNLGLVINGESVKAHGEKLAKLPAFILVSTGPELASRHR
jgi:hypothetical protein